MSQWLNAEDWQELGALLDATFPVQTGKHFFDDFPIWSRPWKLSQTEVRVCGARDESGKLIASAGLRLGTTVEGERVGLIGAVATHPSVRGLGHAREQVVFAREAAAAAGALRVYLWSTDGRLYEDLGFQAAGEQWIVPLDIWLPPLEGPATRQASRIQLIQGWDEKIMTLIRQRPHGLRHAPDDAAWISAHHNTVWLRAEVDGKPLAYLAYGRGIDLQGLVHEWSVDPLADAELGRLALRRLGDALLAAVGKDAIGVHLLSAEAHFAPHAPAVPVRTLPGAQPAGPAAWVWLAGTSSGKVATLADLKMDQTALNATWFWGLDAV